MASLILSDAMISALIAEPKRLPRKWEERLALQDKRGHKERNLAVIGEEGSNFRVILRLSRFNALDFSVILGFAPMGSGHLIRLRRYNGKSHEHTNAIERDRFYGFHIHHATERYQLRGLTPEGYAEETDRYADFGGALRCLIEDCAFEVPGGLPETLF